MNQMTYFLMLLDTSKILCGQVAKPAAKHINYKSSDGHKGMQAEGEGVYG